ncbi:T4 RnlA family RNA ligase [candidate division WWE3 bacterium]|uniref:T4 RnlA family RNA ligase n=1 Tax=candidate division WWE3 bacterium TaxID=2053526 RepID=A0A955RWW7_UNCKA|nr:T4 RnlA family RNA ligase [candidate division WWE3 bacterium]
MKQVNSIQDIISLAQNKSTDWAKYGDVYSRQLDHLVLLNYTQSAIYNRRWNFLERVSRGLIIDTEKGEVAARPFDKFFNWLEGGERSSGHIVSVTEKVDGSLGILYRHNGQYKISTRGGFESAQALWATEKLGHYDMNFIPDNYTLLFEIVYPENRIVVDYGDKEELVLIGARDRFTGEYMSYWDLLHMADQMYMRCAKFFKFNDISEIIADCGELSASNEGYVVEFSDGQRFKFKGDRYLELHKMITNLSFKNTVRAMQNGSIQEIFDTVPNEFLDEVRYWVSIIEFCVQTTRTRALDIYTQAPIDGTRKEFAQWTMGNHKEYAPYLFALLDKQDITPAIYKNTDWKSIEEQYGLRSVGSMEE